MSEDNRIKDKFTYCSDDKINDMVVASVAGKGQMNAIVACNDKQLRVLDTEGKMLYTHQF